MTPTPVVTQAAGGAGAAITVQQEMFIGNLSRIVVITGNAAAQDGYAASLARMHRTVVVPIARVLGVRVEAVEARIPAVEGDFDLAERVIVILTDAQRPIPADKDLAKLLDQILEAITDEHTAQRAAAIQRKRDDQGPGPDGGTGAAALVTTAPAQDLTLTLTHPSGSQQQSPTSETEQAGPSRTSPSLTFRPSSASLTSEESTSQQEKADSAGAKTKTTEEEEDEEEEEKKTTFHSRQGKCSGTGGSGDEGASGTGTTTTTATSLTAETEDNAGPKHLEKPSQSDLEEEEARKKTEAEARTKAEAEAQTQREIERRQREEAERREIEQREREAKAAPASNQDKCSDPGSGTSGGSGDDGTGGTGDATTTTTSLTADLEDEAGSKHIETQSQSDKEEEAARTQTDAKARVQVEPEAQTQREREEERRREEEEKTFRAEHVVVDENTEASKTAPEPQTSSAPTFKPQQTEEDPLPGEDPEDVLSTTALWPSDPSTPGASTTSQISLRIKQAATFWQKKTSGAVEQATSRASSPTRTRASSSGSDSSSGSGSKNGSVATRAHQWNTGTMTPDGEEQEKQEEERSSRPSTPTLAPELDTNGMVKAMRKAWNPDEATQPQKTSPTDLTPTKDNVTALKELWEGQEKTKGLQAASAVTRTLVSAQRQQWEEQSRAQQQPQPQPRPTRSLGETEKEWREKVKAWEEERTKEQEKEKKLEKETELAVCEKAVKDLEKRGPSPKDEPP
ncbi:MAG: hypothetical protein ACRCWB_07340, partial [Enterovibrio sp.]